MPEVSGSGFAGCGCTFCHGSDSVLGASSGVRPPRTAFSNYQTNLHCKCLRLNLLSLFENEYRNLSALAGLTLNSEIRDDEDIVAAFIVFNREH